MCGIFAYLNYNVNRERRYVLQVLFNGLRRLEYRGYDSAGISIDDSISVSSDPNTPDSSSSSASALSPPPLVFRQEGNIESLVKSVYQGQFFFFFGRSSILFGSRGNGGKISYEGPWSSPVTLVPLKSFELGVFVVLFGAKNIHSFSLKRKKIHSISNSFNSAEKIHLHFGWLHFSFDSFEWSLLW